MKKKKILIVSRNQLIVQWMLSKIFFVHNGKAFKRVFINTAKLGTKFGEYVFTRKDCFHHSKKKKKKR